MPGLARLTDPRLLGRHQAAAAVATLVDFAGMIALVELVSLRASVATTLGALLGGVTNFAIARAWAFRDLHAGSMRSQALRYGFVSALGALLNGGFVALILWLIPAPYVLVRAIGAVLISVAYTYPMHARVVFRVRGVAGPEEAAS